MSNSEYQECMDNLNVRDIYRLYERSVKPKYPKLIRAMEKFITINTVDAGIFLRVMSEKARCEHLKQATWTEGG